MCYVIVEKLKHYSILQEMLMLQMNVGSGYFNINGILFMKSSMTCNILSSLLMMY